MMKRSFGPFVDTREKEVEFRGIHPRHQKAYRLFKTLGYSIGLAAALAVGLFSLTTVPLSPRLDAITSHPLYRKYLVGGSILIIPVLLITMVIIYLGWLKKPPFDDWVFELAQKHLSTTTLFYDRKYIYLNYTITGSERNKDDFIKEMRDKSEKYSYYLIKTYIDQQLIQVECVPKQPIPEVAYLDVEEVNKLPNLIPLGEAINEVTMKVSPIGWYLDDKPENEEFIKLPPSVSMLILGGTGSGKSVSEQGM